MEASAQSSRLRLLDVNPHLVCYLCGGYYVDATTIVECLHSFCKSCIIRYLENKNFCPICDVQIHKAMPYRNLRPDKALQTIVYKLVPDLYGKEMQRRREFYSKHPEYALHAKAEDRGIELERMIFSPNENISLALQYLEPERSREEWETVSDSSDGSGRGSPAGLPGASVADAGTPLPSQRTRYLLCPAQVTVAVLKKFLRLKFDLTPSHQVEVRYKTEVLTDNLRLMDIAYIYTWKRNTPMELQYRLLEEGWRERVEDCTRPLMQTSKSHMVACAADRTTVTPPASATSDNATLTAEATKEAKSSKIVGVLAPTVANESARNVPTSLHKSENNSQVSGKERQKKRSGCLAVDCAPSREGVIPPATTTPCVSPPRNVQNATTEAGDISASHDLNALFQLAIPQAPAVLKVVAPADTTESASVVLSRSHAPSSTPVASPVPHAREAMKRPRISMGLLASLAMERRPAAPPHAAAVVRKRPASLMAPSDSVKRPHMAPGAPSPLVALPCSPAPPDKNSVHAPARRQSATVSQRPTSFAQPDLHGQMSSMARLVHVGRTALPERKQGFGHGIPHALSSPRTRDGFGALDLSRSRLPPPNISTIAENLARRQLMQQQQHRLPPNSRPPAPPLSPLSALAPFPPTYGPVRSPPGDRAAIDAAVRASAQRPSSLSSSSPSPPASGDGPQPFRSRFDVQAPSYGDWYNEHLLRCYDSFLRAESLASPQGSFFQYAAATAASANESPGGRK